MVRDSPSLSPIAQSGFQEEGLRTAPEVKPGYWFRETKDRERWESKPDEPARKRRRT